MQPLILVRNLRKRYGASLFGRGGQLALDDVSITVGRGQVFGLLGPNGAGKTTLVKILLGLVKRYEGEAEIFGLRPADPDSRRKAGYLPEAHRLPGYLTGRQMLRLFARMSGMQSSEVDDRMQQLLARVGMSEAADKKISQYSKGMQQRIGLAQALIHQPELVFLDEPTDGVEPVGRMAIRELVAELRAQGVTLFLNSHLLMEVELMCDRAVIMSHGRILREGTMAELTPRTGAVHFGLAGTPPDLPVILTGLGQGLRIEEGGFELGLNDDEIDRVIDRLRSRGVSIRSVTPRKQSLEEAFIGLVRNEKAAR
jgi:ABC-2 type transport system ATP-binding protein